MTFSWFDVGGDNGLQMAWADGDRVFYRGWYSAPVATGTRSSSCFPQRNSHPLTASIVSFTNTD
jgi:hypothetical protein